MRISAEQNDRGYGQFLVCKESGRWPKVFVDGAEIRNVVTADSDAGFVTRLVADADGHFVVDDAGEAVQTDTKRGAVTFEFPDR